MVFAVKHVYEHEVFYENGDDLIETRIEKVFKFEDQAINYIKKQVINFLEDRKSICAINESECIRVLSRFDELDEGRVLYYWNESIERFGYVYECWHVEDEG